MAKALETRIGEDLVEGFAVAQSEEALVGISEKWQKRVGSHPRPDQSSLEAGENLALWIERLPREANVVACVSGGASAILERPLPPYSLADLQRCLDQSFAEGWSIEKLNQERTSRSQIKGGGLARLLGARLKAVYCLSDVEPGRLDILGSGPFWSPETAHLHHLVADRTSVAPLVEAACLSYGLTASHKGSLSKDLSTWLERELSLAIEAAEPGTAFYWLGELTIPLGSNPPPGGRCHEAAAWAVRMLRSGQSLAAFGTDGMDGTSGSSGACVSAEMGVLPLSDEVLRTHRTLDWCRAARASLPPFFTGSNLNDVVLLITQ